jgi:membrane protease YdiL (CAAX protease family)
MRAFGYFLLALVGSLLVAAALTYPLFILLHPLMPVWRFDKIATRLFQLLALGAVLLLVRRLKLDTRADWGYGAPGARWRRDCLIGFLAGIASMLPVTLATLALGIRSVLPEIDFSMVLRAALAGLGSGLAVGFLEETFFRGLMQGAVRRDVRRAWVAILPVSLLYAALHFLARAPIAAEDVTWHSGLDLLVGVAAEFRAPSGILDAFLSLTAVGLLLGLLTAARGHIGAAVGLHAGWVATMRFTIGLTALHRDSPLGWLVSRSDGYTGWLVLAWTLLILALAAGFKRRAWTRESAA